MSGKNNHAGSDKPYHERPDTSRSDATDQIKKDVLSGVGYKRPPVETRFKKGQSGNPKGRPKSTVPTGASLADDLILREAERLITVREGDRTRETTTIEAILRAQTKSAAGGNAYAQKHIIERYDRAARAKQADVAEFIAKAEGYIERCRSEIAEAEACGAPPPRLLPHPDDIVIDRETGVRILGPIDEDEAAKVEETCRMRDALLMQEALDHRLADEVRAMNPSYEPGLSLVFAQLLDRCVPPRMRLSDGEMLRRMERYEGTSKRALLKMVGQAWHAPGAAPCRGKVMPPPSFAEELIEALGE